MRHEAIAAQCRSGSRMEEPRQDAVNGGARIPILVWMLWIGSYPKRSRDYAIAPIRAEPVAAARVWTSIIMLSPLSAIRTCIPEECDLADRPWSLFAVPQIG
jgi:hypothetical protein